MNVLRLSRQKILFLSEFFLLLLKFKILQFLVHYHLVNFQSIRIFQFISWKWNWFWYFSFNWLSPRRQSVWMSWPAKYHTKKYWKLEKIIASRWNQLARMWIFAKQQMMICLIGLHQGCSCFFCLSYGKVFKMVFVLSLWLSNLSSEISGRGWTKFVLGGLLFTDNLKLKKESNELCEIYYEEFHGIKDFSLVNNTYIAAGGQGMVFKCECFQEGIEPSITAQKGKNWSHILWCLNRCWRQSQVDNIFMSPTLWLILCQMSKISLFGISLLYCRR